MATRAYPTGVRIYIDDVDVTEQIFGVDELALSDINNTWRDIDISQYVNNVGLHTLKITCESGVGRAEARLEIE